jgi:hypothetical protein
MPTEEELDPTDELDPIDELEFEDGPAHD